jgi:hypothetical protein
MDWNVEYTDEFGAWYEELSEAIQNAIDRIVGVLEAKGPQLPFPYSSGIAGSRHGQMRELRVQSRGSPIRIFYAFDPRRTAILLIGGDKTGDKHFYENMIPVADQLYDEHLKELKKEGLYHERTSPLQQLAQAHGARPARSQCPSYPADAGRHDVA